MKVLQINSVYNIGSTGRNCAELQNYINSTSDNECKTAFCYGGSSENGYIIGNPLDRKIHALLSRITGKQGYFSKGATEGLIKYIENYKPDIVHLGNLHANFINYPILFKFFADKKIPVVITLHDCWFYTGKCMYYSDTNCYKWQDACGNCPNYRTEGNKSWFLDKTKLLLNEKKQLFASLDKYAIIGVSNWISDEVKHSTIGKNATIVRRIYNWVDFNHFYPRKSDFREKYGLEDKFIILGVASIWIPRKGTRHFVDLANRLNDENKVIVLVGKMSEEIDFPPNVICIDQTESVTQLAEIYSAADAFVTLSSEETFGKVSAEALACGTPVVCFNSTANKEIVGEGCGYVCELGDIDSIVDSLNKIQEDGKQSYYDKCIEYTYKNFNPKLNLQQHFDLYEQLLEE